jgi:hypothetical protein
MRLTAAMIAIAMSAPAVVGQDGEPYYQNWFDIGRNESALAILWNWVGEPPSLVISDGSGNALDKVDWSSGGPLLVQYRLEPGTYEIVVEGAGVQKVALEPGHVTYLNLVDAGADVTAAVTLPPREAVLHLLREVEASGANIQPMRLEPVGPTLHLNTEPPFEIPKPSGGGPKPR